MQRRNSEDTCFNGNISYECSKGYLVIASELFSSFQCNSFTSDRMPSVGLLSGDIGTVVCCLPAVLIKTKQKSWFWGCAPKIDKN